MIKSFSCSNFRNVNVKNLRFSKINILIGPNNSGKINLGWEIYTINMLRIQHIVLI